MARFLLDTNVLIRIANGLDMQNAVASGATIQLISDGHDVFLAPQNVIEFWSVATRPLANNGLNWDSSRVEQQVQTFLSRFQLLEDNAKIFDAWRQLVVTHQVRGKSVHDARLVAVMQTHQITHLLTFNIVDFVRYPNITTVNPASIAPVP